VKTIRVRCCIPHCSRTVRVPEKGLTHEGICDACWVLAPERMRDAYLRYEGRDMCEVYRLWAKCRRWISRKATRPA